MLSSRNVPILSDDAHPGVVKQSENKVKRKALGNISLNSLSNTPGHKGLPGTKPSIGNALKPTQNIVKFDIEEFHDPAEMLCSGFSGPPPDPYEVALNNHRSKKPNKSKIVCLTIDNYYLKVLDVREPFNFTVYFAESGSKRETIESQQKVAEEEQSAAKALDLAEDLNTMANAMFESF